MYDAYLLQSLFIRVEYEAHIYTIYLHVLRGWCSREKRSTWRIQPKGPHGARDADHPKEALVVGIVHWPTWFIHLNFATYTGLAFVAKFGRRQN